MLGSILDQHNKVSNNNRIGKLECDAQGVFKKQYVRAQKTTTLFLSIQDIVKVDYLLIKHVNIVVTLISTQTVWTLDWTVRTTCAKLY